MPVFGLAPVRPYHIIHFGECQNSLRRLLQGVLGEWRRRPQARSRCQASAGLPEVAWYSALHGLVETARPGNVTRVQFGWPGST
jgi:hypothetical protein